jgi:hypothetical protein
MSRLFNEFQAFNEDGYVFAGLVDNAAKDLLKQAEMLHMDLRDCQVVATMCISQRFSEAIMITATRRYKANAAMVAVGKKITLGQSAQTSPGSRSNSEQVPPSPEVSPQPSEPQ